MTVALLGVSLHIGQGVGETSSVHAERTLEWSVFPGRDRIGAALCGKHGPVRYSFRFLKVTPQNVLVADVTPAITEASIELNNDRDVVRTAKFAIDPEAVPGVTIDPLADHVAVIMRLLVDRNFQLDFQLGVFMLHFPQKEVRPTHEVWNVDASDLTMHLMEDTVVAPYTIAAGQNYISGTNGVRDVIAARLGGLRHAIDDPGLTAPTAQTWEPGTPWLNVVNDMLHAVSFYSVWADVKGVLRSGPTRELGSQSPAVAYSTDCAVLVPWDEEAEVTRLANKVIVVVEDPSVPPMWAVAVNDKPNSPTSILPPPDGIGRVITKTITRPTVADQDTLDEIAARELEQSGSFYRRGTLLTPIDPRREPHEVYEVAIPGVSANERWWCRNWNVDLATGAKMEHNLARVEAIT